MPIAHAYQLVSRTQVASLAFLFYDILVTLDDEVNTIWSKPYYSWVKWQFLFTRYFALAVQIVNRTLEHALVSHWISVTISIRNWYLCQAAIGSLLMSAVEIVLMARVYALYRRNTYIRTLFMVLIFAEVVALVVGIAVNIPGGLGVHDILMTSPNSYTYFGISAIVSQITIIGLTLVKYKVAVDGGWGKIPIIMLMVRDGTVAFFILLVVTTMTVVGTNRHTEYVPIGNSWFLSIVACSGCRLILNMQNLPSQTANSSMQYPSEVLLTTLWSGPQMDLDIQLNCTTSLSPSIPAVSESR